MNDIDRFFDKVSPEPNTGCHLWTGALNTSGYGHAKYKGKVTPAHRISCDIAGRPLAGIGAHKCHVKICVNPDHIIDATLSENMLMESDKAGKPRGIYHDPRRVGFPWSARVRGVNIGTFATFEDAVSARDKYLESHR